VRAVDGVIRRDLKVRMPFLDRHPGRLGGFRCLLRRLCLPVRLEA
jgi:hypothetical protein